MNLYVSDADDAGFTVHATRGQATHVGILDVERLHEGFLVVSLVQVEEPYRRQGIATRMLRYAEEYAGAPISHSVDRNDLSDAWSLTTGNPRPQSAREMAIQDGFEDVR